MNSSTSLTRKRYGIGTATRSRLVPHTEPRGFQARPTRMRSRSVVALLAFSLLIGGCALRPAASASSAGSAGTSVDVTGTVMAGPTCPVVTEPPQPGCDARPVAAAVLVVLGEDGTHVARVTAAADGTFSVPLAPGRYRLVPQPVRGLMGTAPEQRFTVGERDPKLTVTYDTGIR